MLALWLEPVICRNQCIIEYAVAVGTLDHGQATIILCIAPIGLCQVVPAPGIAGLNLDRALQIIDSQLELFFAERGERLVLQFSDRSGFGHADFNIVLIAVARYLGDGACTNNREQ